MEAQGDYLGIGYIHEHPDVVPTLPFSLPGA